MVKEKLTSQFGAVDRRKLRKTTKNQFKTAQFFFLHPGLLLFKMPPVLGA